MRISIGEMYIEGTPEELAEYDRLTIDNERIQTVYVDGVKYVHVPFENDDRCTKCNGK